MIRSLVSILGYSQVVRQQTLTLSSRWFESSYSNQMSFYPWPLTDTTDTENTQTADKERANFAVSGAGVRFQLCVKRFRKEAGYRALERESHE